MIRVVVLISLITLSLGSQNLCGQQDGPLLTPPPAGAAAAAAPKSEEREKPSADAERIARAYRTIENTRKLVAELRAQIDDPAGEYQQFQQSFLKVDAEYEQKRNDLEELQAAGKGEEAAAIEAELPRVE